MASTQRLPIENAGFTVRHRDVALGHVAPTGWWNLLALSVAAVALSLVRDQAPGLKSDGDVKLATWSVMVLRFALPAAMGLALGWLARRAVNNDETHLFKFWYPHHG